ncbi:cyclase family protein [Jannaschia sp. W003]|uniref:cyclase family protein n=1 Tax=Jannaschia sp. W003 TaxID=2867012 RepID=UPI0021A7DAA8|nr:cyclase family protein [Jannaschia sp. W003]UWQ21801.1 cyclase family protein [Jannaschia sp. W003]
MARRFIDLSVALDAEIVSDPPLIRPEIEYLGHGDTADQVAGFFPGLRRDQLPQGEGWAIERLRIATHNGTHLDAPYHHHSTMNRRLVPGGEPAATIDEVPLEWCFAPGVRIDFRHLPDGYVATAGDVEAELRRIGHDLAPLDIVVVNTAAAAHYGADDYIHRGCGVGREATLWLLERGVRVTGTDAWSWDAPFSHTAARWKRERDPAVIWEGHRASMEIGYCHMEKLANLDQLPDHGFTVSCFPYKIRGASAGFTRAVAILEDA